MVKGMAICRLMSNVAFVKTLLFQELLSSGGCISRLLHKAPGITAWLSSDPTHGGSPKLPAPSSLLAFQGRLTHGLGSP